MHAARPDSGENTQTEGPEPRVEGFGVFSLYVGTTSGRSARVRFEVRRDTVEVWHWERLHGVFVRDELAAWLAEPSDCLVVDEVALSVDRMVDRNGRVAVTLPDVRAWTFSPAALDELRDRVWTSSAPWA